MFLLDFVENYDFLDTILAILDYFLRFTSTYIQDLIKIDKE